MSTELTRITVIRRLYTMTPIVARTEALRSMQHYERLGGFFSLTQDQQVSYGVCRDFLVDPDAVKVEYKASLMPDEKVLEIFRALQANKDWNQWDEIFAQHGTTQADWKAAAEFVLSDGNVRDFFDLLRFKDQSAPISTK